MMVLLLRGQPEVKANPIMAFPPVASFTTLLNRNNTDVVVGVKLNQMSSSFSTDVQEGLGNDRVAPAVVA